MDSFSKAVKECRKKESSRVLENASIEHAKELFLNLIEEGQDKKEDISIVSGNLNSDFYSELVIAAENAIKKGSKITLLVTNPDIPLETNPFALALIKAGGVVYRTKTLINTLHFIVVGNKRFRIETDHDQTKALACFNNSEVGQALNKVFKDLIDSTNIARFNEASFATESTQATA